jgi:hypothetical protein
LGEFERTFAVAFLINLASSSFARASLDSMAEAAAAAMFPACTMTRARAEKLVAKGFLPKEAESGWRVPPLGSRRPEPRSDEVVVLAAFFERGLGLPANRFFRGLLHFYGLELHHLNPNTVLQISAFIVLCEAYLGIRPNFALWRYFFLMRPIPESKSVKTPALVGGAGAQLRLGMGEKYPQIPLKKSLGRWSSDWFYIKNRAEALRDGLPRFSGRIPQESESFKAGITAEEKITVDILVDMIGELKEAGLTGAGLCWTFFERRVQPLKVRPHFMWFYSDRTDPMRESHEELSTTEVASRLVSVLEKKMAEAKLVFAGHPPPRSLATDASNVSSWSVFVFDRKIDELLPSPCPVLPVFSLWVPFVRILLSRRTRT